MDLSLHMACTQPDPLFIEEEKGIDVSMFWGKEGPEEKGGRRSRMRDRDWSSWREKAAKL